MADDNTLELKFEPRTIEHLGVRMYSQLPPALAELVSNGYDADAERVTVELEQEGSQPVAIKVTDDGHGMSFEDLRKKFLVIGRNRRDEEEGGDHPSTKFGRLATGKKGLGKLALFGIAGEITVTTRKDGKENSISLSWEEIMASEGTYTPDVQVRDATTTAPAGTEILLTNLKRRSPFDPEGLAKGLARIFYFDDDFHLTVKGPGDFCEEINNSSKYETVEREFTWTLADLDVDTEAYEGLRGEIITSLKPLPPQSGLRGITIYSRGKLVNAPEFFTNSISSNFYQYTTGYIIADFIDGLKEDVISTGRQALDWEHPKMEEFRPFARQIVSKANAAWRKKRKEKKKKRVQETTGVDPETWTNTMPAEAKESLEAILSDLTEDEAVEEATTAKVVKGLQELVPPYPLLHWRHLHPDIRERVREYYQNEQYGHAASQGCQIYLERVEQLTNHASSVDSGKLQSIFKLRAPNPPNLQVIKGLATESEQNIQQGQAHLSQGVYVGFRNPISHTPIDTAVAEDGLFTEENCLDILSLISYLYGRLDEATHNPR